MARPWPSAAQWAGGGGSPSLDALRRSWERAPGGENAEWVYAYTRLYAPTDAALARYGARKVSDLPTEAALSKSDFQNDPDRLYARARLPLVGVALVLALLVFFWARELHGTEGALLSLSLFCFSPSFLAHAPLVTTDVGFAAFFFGSAYFFRRALRGGRARDAAAAAAFCALACVSKFSAVLLAPALAALALVHAAQGPARGRGPRLWRAAVLAACALATAWAAIWAAYLFRYAAAPAASSAFPWAGVLPAGGGPVAALLRLCRDRRLLPEAFVYGVAFARHRAALRSSFLFGALSNTGFRAFFPAAFALKTPLPQLALIAGGLVLLARRREGRAQLCWLLAAPAVYGAAALASRLDIGHRHILPVYPFLFVAAGAVAGRGGRRARLAALAGGLACALSALLVFAPPWRPQAVYPDFLAYFNEAAGGPDGGSRFLVDSDLDWGQGLKSLSSWLSARGVTEPIGLCYFGTAEPRFYGVRYVNLPGGLPFAPQAGFEGAPAPGWLAVSATDLRGVYQDAALREAWARFLQKTQAQAVAAPGRSLFVYRLTAPF